MPARSSAARGAEACAPKPLCGQPRMFSTTAASIFPSPGRAKTPLPPGRPQPLLVEFRHFEKLALRGKRPARDQGVDVRMPVQEFAVGLDRDDHARQGVPSPEQAADFRLDAPPRTGGELAEQLAVEAGVQPQPLRDGHTTCRWATGEQTSSATCRAVSNARF